MNLKPAIRATVLTVAVFSLSVLQAEPQDPVVESTVPELTEFHDVIYPIWHTAYPEKDYAALRRFAPEVKSGAEKIFAAKLPAILHEKQEKWNRGLIEFRAAVDDYLKSAADSNDQALLAAAEVLHAKYEMLVRIIRPVLKEIEAFHKVLYVIYHKYLPDKNYEGIRAVSEDLTLKAEAITKASLPKRLEEKTEAFKTAAEALYESTKALGQALASGEGKAVEAAVEAVHTKYQVVEKIFD